MHDYYITPMPAINEFLQEFNKTVGIEWKHMRVLDPSSGGDKGHLMSYPTAIIETCGVIPGDIMTIDIREDSLAKIKADYLKFDVKSINGYPPDIIITNPPFDLTQEFIEKALDDVSDGGYVIMLLRLNFFGSQKRKEFWKNKMALYCFVHSKRMSFTPDGKTDSVEYSHMIWRKGISPEFCKIKVI